MRSKSPLRIKSLIWWLLRLTRHYPGNKLQSSIIKNWWCFKWVRCCAYWWWFCRRIKGEFQLFSIEGLTRDRLLVPSMNQAPKTDRSILLFDPHFLGNTCIFQTLRYSLWSRFSIIYLQSPNLNQGHFLRLHKALPESHRGHDSIVFTE